MDKTRLAAVVYKRTGYPLEPTDSVFAMVELNRVVLEDLIEDAAGRLAERLDTLPDRIQSSGTSVAAEVATQGMQRVVEMLTESRRTIGSDAEQAQRRIAEQTEKASKDLSRQVGEVVRAAQSLSRGGAARARWLLAGAVIGATCCAVGFVTSELVTSASVLQRVHGP